MGKPFLILQLRPGNKESDDEFAAIVRYGGLVRDKVHRIRMESAELPPIHLKDYSAVIVGGGPSCISNPPERKSFHEKQFEAWMFELIDEIIDADFPYLGACYGMGALCLCVGGEVSKAKYSEGPGAVDIKLTTETKQDPLTKNLPSSFRAFVGHKEACQALPHGAIHLASSDACPMQMFRVKNNIYGTQFHPELDSASFALRARIYKDAGYFPPDDAEKLINQGNKENITVPMEILKRFVDKYRA